MSAALGTGGVGVWRCVRAGNVPTLSSMERAPCWNC
jgi:hypothetical protein